MRKLLLVLMLLIAQPALAATPCDEWANMTKVLVMRWQGDVNFSNKTLPQVQAELEVTMGNHPEIKTAQKWLIYAHTHREADPVQTWKEVYDQCRTERSI